MRVTRKDLFWAWLRSTSGSERAGAALLVVAVLLGLVVAWFQGHFVATNVGRPGWICDNSFTRGSPFCVRDPRGGM